MGKRPRQRPGFLAVLGPIPGVDAPRAPAQPGPGAQPRSGSLPHEPPLRHEPAAQWALAVRSNSALDA
eukprot:636848-Lingulodinium_polyedra.AAC.1